MKKNKMMRLASTLLVLTLLTTCAISGTFAKYVTKSEGSDSARVAKWGFEATNSSVVLDNLFASAYDSTVKSTTDVIAPGTKNQVSFSFAYDTTSNNVATPEVAYTFEVSTTGSTCDQSIQDNTSIVWSLDGALASADGKTAGSWDALLAAIEALDGNKTNNQYDANTLPESFYGSTTEGAKTHTVGWEWKFDNNNDTTDTTMGNADSLAKVELHISITATQVD